ncbi:MAG: DUF1643 domain-containing protein [Verrucomicrobiota bacterium]
MNPTCAQHDPGGKSRPAWPPDSKVTARFSKCGQYRYELAEIWDDTKPLVLWILMNPSVACLDYSDPTLRRTGNFSRAWGYGGQLVGNVHAYRATDKNRLLAIPDPVGPENDKSILSMARRAKIVILAYGAPPKKLKHRGPEVASLLAKHRGLSFLKLSKDGVTPIHPLYLPSDLVPKPYKATRIA